MDAIILQILNGLDKGSAYALIALGLTLIFGTLGVVNFAHGALFMIGAFCAVTLSRILTFSHTVIDETKTDFLGNPLKVQVPYVQDFFGEAAGATIINDVSALTGDESLETAARLNLPVILMHMQGTPQTMQDNPTYNKPSEDIRNYLAGRIAVCEAAEISRDRIAVDAGIGFGKTLDHNLELLAHMDVLHALACAVVLGVSRKSFIGRLTCAEDPQERVAGSVAAALATRDLGVQIFRVHDVAQTRQAFDVWEAIRRTHPS